MDLQTVFVAVDEELNSYHVHHLRTRKKIRGKRKKRGSKREKEKNELNSYHVQHLKTRKKIGGERKNKGKIEKKNSMPIMFIS